MMSRIPKPLGSEYTSLPVGFQSWICQRQEGKQSNCSGSQFPTTTVTMYCLGVTNLKNGSPFRGGTIGNHKSTEFVLVCSSAYPRKLLHTRKLAAVVFATNPDMAPHAFLGEEGRDKHQTYS